MKRGWLSKRVFPLHGADRLKNPGFFVIVFLFGVFMGSLPISPAWGFLLVAFLACLSLVLLIFKKPFLASAPAVFVLGSFYFLLFGALQSGPINPGCRDAKIVSNLSERASMQQFLISDRTNQNAIVETLSADKFGYGDIVNICFKSENIKSLSRSDENFYLSRYKTDLLIENPQISFKQSGRGFLRSLYNLSDAAGRRLKLLFAADSGVLAKGLILGGQSGFSKSFVADLKSSGTTHLVAVSGYNVSIITIVLFDFIRRYFSRRIALASSFVFLVGFCLMTGAGASVLRASLMGILYLGAIIIGRKNSIANALLVAALLMVLVNPYALYDVGFQLSFMATFGLVLLGEPLDKMLFSRIKYNPVTDFTGAFSETLAAQIFTLPILLFSFGRLSVVAPLANVLILPFVPLTMALISLTLLGSIIFGPLGIFLAGLTRVLLDYFIAVVHVFGRLRFASFEISGLNWIWVLLLYWLIFILSKAIKTKIKQQLHS